MSKAYIFLFFFLTWSLRLMGDLVELPKGPAQWEINVTKSSHNATPEMSGDLQKVEVKQNDETRRAVTTSKSGHVHTIWSLIGSNLLILEAPDGSVALTTPSRFSYFPYPDSVFEWISPQTLQEKDPIDHAGKLCFHYKSTTTVTQFLGHGFGDVSVPCEAWIDSKTSLPVTLDDGLFVADFSFESGGTALVMPPKMRSVLDGYKKTMGLSH